MMKLYDILWILLIHSVSTIVVEIGGNPNKIVDLGFHLFPQISAGWEQLLAFGFPLAYMYWTYCNQRQDLLDTFLKKCAVIMIIRSICILVTILPPKQKCDLDILMFFHGGCYDKIFSGHIAYQLLAILRFRRTITNPKLIKLFIASVVFEAFLLIASREHYTIDIVIAVFVTMLVEENDKI